MHDSDRDQLLHRIHTLERSRGRWRLVALGLTAILALGLLGGGFGLALTARVQMARARAEEARAVAEAEKQRTESQRLQAEEKLKKAKQAERRP
jgi:hypothetical protein